jgi:hypothetical protein
MKKQKTDQSVKPDVSVHASNKPPIWREGFVKGSRIMKSYFISLIRGGFRHMFCLHGR